MLLPNWSQFPASHTDTIHLCSAWTSLRLLNSIKMINQAKLVQKQSLVWGCKYLDSALRKVVAIAGWWIDINCTLLVFFLVFFASGEWIHRYHAGYHFPLLSNVTTAWSFLSSLKILTPFSRMISNYFLLIKYVLVWQAGASTGWRNSESAKLSLSRDQAAKF